MERKIEIDTAGYGDAHLRVRFDLSAFTMSVDRLILTELDRYTDRIKAAVAGVFASEEVLNSFIDEAAREAANETILKYARALGANEAEEFIESWAARKREGEIQEVMK